MFQLIYLIVYSIADDKIAFPLSLRTDKGNYIVALVFNNNKHFFSLNWLNHNYFVTILKDKDEYYLYKIIVSSQWR